MKEEGADVLSGRDSAACKGGSQHEYCKKYGNCIFHSILPLIFSL